MAHFSTYIQRRTALVSAVKVAHPQFTGPIVIAAACEDDRYRFLQESTFYYFTGLNEPGAVLVLELDGSATLFIPSFTTDRSRWVASECMVKPELANTYGFKAILPAGKPRPGYFVSPVFSVEQYEHVLTHLQQHASFGVTQVGQSLLERLWYLVPSLPRSVLDLAPIVAGLRRKKSKDELEAIYKAVELTMVAQEAAAQCIADSVREQQVQAGIAYVFAEAGAQEAFPTIVASGKWSTTLHYTCHTNTMRDGDLVVVDCGARLHNYCADITRTYPVSGRFSSEQRKLYELVLATQNYVATLAKPGMYLCNKEKPQQSLQHLAVAFVEKHGYASAFLHNIGHFLGLDVHDVGATTQPLQEGDVITIEPGLYIPEAQLGIRIEDDYWVVRDGVECMSAHLPKNPEEIEEMAQATMHECVDESCCSEDEGEIN